MLHHVQDRYASMTLHQAVAGANLQPHCLFPASAQSHSTCGCIFTGCSTVRECTPQCTCRCIHIDCSGTSASLEACVLHPAQASLKMLGLRCRSSSQDVTAVVGAVNATTILLGALHALNVLPVISVERAVYYRERASYFFHCLRFSLAQRTVELPYIVVQACVYSCVCIGALAWSSMLVWLASFLLCVSANVNHRCRYHFAVCCMLLCQ